MKENDVVQSAIQLANSGYTMFSSPRCFSSRVAHSSWHFSPIRYGMPRTNGSTAARNAGLNGWLVKDTSEKRKPLQWSIWPSPCHGTNAGTWSNPAAMRWRTAS